MHRREGKPSRHNLDFTGKIYYNGALHYNGRMRHVFKIAICDDEDTLIGELKECLERYAAGTGREFAAFVYHDGRELLERCNGE